VPKSLNTDLKQGLEALKLELSEESQKACLKYIDLIIKWNNISNLTSITDKHEILIKHLLDSLAIQGYIANRQLLDVGTGAGLPGIPLALSNSELAVTLLDSNGKKVRFLKQMIIDLPLKNVSTIKGNVQNLDVRFPVVISRAVGSVEHCLNIMRPACLPQAQVLLMKGKYPEKELQQLPQDFIIKDVPVIHVPRLNAERHLVIAEYTPKNH
jgi:16S rRNA (guanine527-N7)-methyltransferase